MKTFDFMFDQKVTTWYRTPFEIEAKTFEEAKELAIKFVKEGEHESIGWEQVDEVIEFMSVEENDGQPTEELRTDDFDGIWDNTKE
jgi:outer membrane protein assembly factor BamE (lipoprotein component of BamABCDE complex)